jgi:hypothetical protein
MPYQYLYNSKLLDKVNLKSEELFFNGDRNGPINGNFGTTYKEEEGKKILNAVNQGKSVILLIPNHYIVLGPNSECNSNQVYYYDPDWAEKKGCYTPSEIYTFTWNNGWCTSSEHYCGWHLAYAFYNK